MSEGRALRFTRTAEKELRRLDPPVRARVLVTTTHRLAVYAERERWVCVAHFVHDDAGVLAERVEHACESPAKGVRRNPLGQWRAFVLG